MISKRCTMCQTAYEGEDYFELRKFFSPSKQNKDGLESRCKVCKKEMAKKVLLEAIKPEVSIPQTKSMIYKNREWYTTYYDAYLEAENSYVFYLLVSQIKQ